MTEILGLCHEVLNTHNEANRKSLGGEVDLRQDLWCQDKQWADEIIRYGRQYGEQVAHATIFPNRNHAAALDADRETLSESGKAAVDMFKKSKKNLDKETWGMAARSQVAAISALLKTISDEK